MHASRRDSPEAFELGDSSRGRVEGTVHSPIAQTRSGTALLPTMGKPYAGSLNRFELVSDDLLHVEEMKK